MAIACDTTNHEPGLPGFDTRLDELVGFDPYQRPFERSEEILGHCLDDHCDHDRDMLRGSPSGIDGLAARDSRAAGDSIEQEPQTDDAGRTDRAAAPTGDERPRDAARFWHYINASCDLTMRGGTTSGVVYPLAVCELAKQYVFRSVGGASAGAIAAAATAAAEFGRCTPPRPAPVGNTAPVDSPVVDPGFGGLAQIIRWLTGPGREQWRLAQLFQPSAATRPYFRVVAAAMQGTGELGTGKNKLRCLAVALLAVLGPAQLLVLGTVVVLWLITPVFTAFVPPSRWHSSYDWLQSAVILATVAALASSSGAARRAVRDRKVSAEQASCARNPSTWAWRSIVVPSLLAIAPLVVGLSVAMTRFARDDVSGGGWQRALSWWATVAAVILVWLALTLAAVATFAAMLGLVVSHLMATAERTNFGLVPGITTASGRWTRLLDRAAGMPKPTGVPALSEWLADRIDDLAGVPLPEGSGARHALTFGDLWCGSLAAPAGDDPKRTAESMRRLSQNPRLRVTNLELMTTNLSQGRPYRLPFADNAQTAMIGGAIWLFCAQCLCEVLPARVVEQVRKASGPLVDPASLACVRHPTQRLRLLPEPWDMPIAMAARMSLSLPGLISAVPLYCPPDQPDCQPLRQWFSDGGITSNFPIHFFDSLLPRWPTFGLTLQPFDPQRRRECVYIPDQDSAATAESWAAVYSMPTFLASILDTFLGWRDTMQTALPGFRGRIAHVRQTKAEGGTNLFMRCETIKTLANRGATAGSELGYRFAGQDDVDVPKSNGRLQTQTDRYRWIRMRVAARKYAEMVCELLEGEPIYRHLAETYMVPAALRKWFEPPPRTWPWKDSDGPALQKAFTTLAALAAPAVGSLAKPFAGTPTVNPDLRLTPRE